ncbi:tail protein [Caulobacter phage C1]|nr:tail protein [Caulobacter phage C1]UTU08869.1 tail protein [Caulobacter phage J4]UTU09985.1 tail protein [Caulobacter phage RB23]WGN97010.1 tail protein [Bertelyvirus sp.]WGN97537.1 tail protein [Bertelyvirus sp.]
MAISDSEKVDFLWKKIIYGATKTASAANKAGSNEAIPSPVVAFSDYVWTQSNLIPLSPPTNSTPIVEVYTGVHRIQMTNDPTSPVNQSWLATVLPPDLASRVGDFIPPAFGTGYAVKVFIGDPATGPAARIFPETTNEEWVFDYSAGVVTFPNSVPAAKTATIGSGTVAVGTHGIFVEGYQYIGKTGGGAGELVIESGFDLPLGETATAGDGSWTDGAIPFTDDTKVSDAIDQLNEVLGLLVPAQPPAFPNAALSVANSTGSSPRLAVGVTDNSTTSTITAGSAVTRITAAGVSSNLYNDVGPGKNGNVALFVNGAIVGQRALVGSGDNGTYNGLVIADQKDFPVATPGFWKSVDISVNLATVPDGVNSFQLAHSGAGATGVVYFVKDNMTAVPALSTTSVVEASLGTVAYSSSIPHYNTGASLTVQASMNNIAGETFYGGADPLTLQGTNSIATAQTYDYTALGITTPIARQTTTPVILSPVTIQINGANVHAAGTIQGYGKNPAGQGAAANMSLTSILVKRGSAGARIDEMSVPVTGLGSSPNANNAVRVSAGSGDTPTGSATAWNSANALATHEAAVVGGVLKHDQTNYTTGVLPVGPDLSVGRSGAQYATFSFNRSARSGFKIVIAGSYAGCWVKLPGVSTAQPNAAGGWWNAFQAYDGAGIPGEAGDPNAGCATGAVMNGGSGTFAITFGTESSTNATGNEIIVRLKLNPGQSVTALSFTN